MEYETLTVGRSSSGVVLVRLNRPPVNAVNKRMQLEIRECFDSLSLERSVRAVVLAASGTKVFSAGIDLKEISSSEAAEDVRTALDFGIDWRDAQHAVRHCSVPVIAAV